MRFKFINIIIPIFCLVSFSFGNINEYQNNINALKSKIEQKNILKAELDNINDQIKVLEKDKVNWIEKRKLAKLSQEKSEKSDDIMQLYKEISEQKIQCHDEFRVLIMSNRTAIDTVLEDLENNDQERTALIPQLLDLKQKRDYLLDSQKYFVKFNEESLEPDNNFDYLNFTDETLKNDFISILNIKIQNVIKAKNAAQKEVVMRSKLNEFRDEIAAFHEPRNDFSTQNEKSYANPEGNRGGDYDGGWEAVDDADEKNYQNSLSASSSGFDYNFESIKTEDDFLYLFEGQNDESVELFIKRMDSLKVYYEDILDNISK